MKSVLLRCDSCTNTTPEPRLGQPEGWFLVISNSPLMHFCSIGCLSMWCHPRVAADHKQVAS